MKKVLFSLAVLSCAALVSCGGHKEEANDSVETVATELVEVAEVNDSAANDSAAADTAVAVEAAAETEAPAAN